TLSPPPTLRGTPAATSAPSRTASTLEAQRHLDARPLERREQLAHPTDAAQARALLSDEHLHVVRAAEAIEHGSVEVRRRQAGERRVLDPLRHRPPRRDLERGVILPFVPERAAVLDRLVAIPVPPLELDGVRPAEVLRERVLGVELA